MFAGRTPPGRPVSWREAATRTGRAPSWRRSRRLPQLQHELHGLPGESERRRIIVGALAPIPDGDADKTGAGDSGDACLEVARELTHVEIARSGGTPEHDDGVRTHGDREAARRAAGESLADHVKNAPLSVVPGHGARILALDLVADVDQQQVTRLAEVVPEARGAERDRLLAGVGAAQQVRCSFAPKPFLHLDGGPHLGEGQRDTGGGGVDQRPIDRPEVSVGRQEEVAATSRPTRTATSNGSRPEPSEAPAGCHPPAVARRHRHPATRPR